VSLPELAEVFDDPNELVGQGGVEAGEVDEVFRAGEDCTLFWVPATVMPRPRRNSSSPSSRITRRARRMVLVLTSRTAARSLAGGGVLRVGFAFCDRASDLTGDLLIEVASVAAAYVI